jgi:hypothetical protein
MSAHPSGYINYGRDGRMMVIIVGSDRTLVTQPSNDPASGKKTVRTLIWERLK